MRFQPIKRQKKCAERRWCLFVKVIFFLSMFFLFCTGAMNATESEYEPVSDYELEGAVSDYDARSEFDDTDDLEKDKSMSKRSARV